MWLNETAEAACGGDPFAGQFADTFRFLNQLGTLAQKGVQVVMHNTLAASDYSLVTHDTLQPKPNFWAAVLWKKTMGTTVLDPGKSSDAALRIYAQCGRARKRALHCSCSTQTKARSTQSRFPRPLNATPSPVTHSIAQQSLNGSPLQAAPDGSLPPISGQPVTAGTVTLDPQSITFLTIPSAKNKSCK